MTEEELFRAPPPPLPPSRSRRGRRLAAVLVLIIAAAVAWFVVKLFQPFHGKGTGAVAVTIPAGAGTNQIGDLLERRGVIDSSFWFSLRARVSGKRGSLRSGRFVLRRGMSYGAVIDALTTEAGIGPTVHIVVPEGRSRQEIAPTVAAVGLRGDYLAATRRSPLLDLRRYGAPASTPSLEGFLYPATYELPQHASVDKLVAEQLKAFQQAFATVPLRYAKRKNLTPYDVLTIASMVEREALVAKDRPLIAAVIYNRLHKRIQLGIDATIRYALNNWTRPLRVSELHIDSPYNTRERLGLPPTPIGNPGLASIRAAAQPARVPYLYYVVKPCGDGAHSFSSTYAKFLHDQAAYEAARRRRGGKSPVHC
jgi:uncharacterized YceG family protein